MFKVKVKSCTKGQWYKNDIGKVFEIKNYCDVTEVYWIKGSEFGIPSADAEVVEEIEKSCDTCKYKGCKLDTVKYCTNDNQYFYWQPIESTAEKFYKLEFEQCLPLLFTNVEKLEKCIEHCKNCLIKYPDSCPENCGCKWVRIELEKSMRETVDPSKIIKGSEQQNLDDEYEKLQKKATENIFMGNRQQGKSLNQVLQMRKYSWESSAPPLRSCETCHNGRIATEDNSIGCFVGRMHSCRCGGVKDYPDWQPINLSVVRDCLNGFYKLFNSKSEVRNCDTCGYTNPCDRCRDSNLTEWIPCEPMESCCGQAEPPKSFTREDLTKEINQSCDDIKKLFSYKNQDYGMVEDAFANFRKTAERIIVPFMDRHGVQIDIKDAMYLVLSIYVDKHAVALSQTGLRGNEVAERLGDIANYSLIAKAMLKGG